MNQPTAPHDINEFKAVHDALTQFVENTEGDDLTPSQQTQFDAAKRILARYDQVVADSVSIPEVKIDKAKTMSPKQVRALRAAVKPGGIGVTEFDGRSTKALKARGLIEVRDSTICPNHYCYYATAQGRDELQALGFTETGGIVDAVAARKALGF